MFVIPPQLIDLVLVFDKGLKFVLIERDTLRLVPVPSRESGHFVCWPIWPSGSVVVQTEFQSVGQIGFVERFLRFVGLRSQVVAAHGDLFLQHAPFDRRKYSPHFGELHSITHHTNVHSVFTFELAAIHVSVSPQINMFCSVRIECAILGVIARVG